MDVMELGFARCLRKAEHLRIWLTRLLGQREQVSVFLRSNILLIVVLPLLTIFVNSINSICVVAWKTVGSWAWSALDIVVVDPFVRTVA